MKPFKHMLLLLAATLITAIGHSQIFYFPVTVNYNQCYSSAGNTPNGYRLDSLHVVTPPAHGTLSAVDTDYVYCPDNGFTGSDTALVYACVYNGALLVSCMNVALVFNVQAPPCPITIALVQDSLVCIGGNRSYQAVVTGGSPPYSYLWSDGTTTSSACEQSPIGGICVTVTDANCAVSNCTNGGGCQINVTISDVVPCAGPLPGLIATATGGTPPYTYYWSNNATTDMICNLTAGTYYVSVIDANNCVGDASFTIGGGGGICSLSYAQSPAGSIVNFIANGGTSWTWLFGDGTSSTLQNPVHTFPGCGIYNVQLWVRDNFLGDSCYTAQPIYVYCDSLNQPGCQAYFYAHANPLNNQFYFIDQSAYAPVTWAWDFGDGDTSSLQSPQHTYATQGTWTVCLTITDGNGCSSNYCQQVSNVPVQDVQAYLFHQTSVTPGFPVWAYLDYYNVGNVSLNGTVTYRYPAGTTYVASSITPVTHDIPNRLLTFSYSGLLPNSSGNIYVELTVDVNLPLGSFAKDTMWVSPVAGDATPFNNVSIINTTVTGAWDPNDKAVSPQGEGSDGVVAADTKEISYRIRFQNTGNAPAQKVEIRDDLSNNIDLTSVKVTSASHEHITTITGSQLRVVFDNINLADSGADYEASQGYINVYAKLKPGLTPGTQIFNTAEIYFDFNLPVITNTVVTTLKTDGTWIGETPALTFAMLPNPASNYVLIRGEFETGATFDLMDQLGRTILKGGLTGNSTQINTATLNTGIYIVKVNSAEKTGVQRLVIAK